MLKQTTNPRQEISRLLLLQFRMMMDCFLYTGADFELISNGEFACDDMTKIPAGICNDYGIRLNVASVNYAGHFEIDGECIGTLGDIFITKGLSARFGVGLNSADAEDGICINDSGAFDSISLHIPPHVANVEMTALRDELRNIVLMQQLKQPYYGN